MPSLQANAQLEPAGEIREGGSKQQTPTLPARRELSAVAVMSDSGFSGAAPLPPPSPAAASTTRGAASPFSCAEAGCDRSPTCRAGRRAQDIAWRVGIRKGRNGSAH